MRAEVTGERGGLGAVPYGGARGADAYAAVPSARRYSPMNRNVDVIASNTSKNESARSST